MQIREKTKTTEKEVCSVTAFQQIKLSVSENKNYRHTAGSFLLSLMLHSCWARRRFGSSGMCSEAVLAHWPEVSFYKLIIELPQMQQLKHIKEGKECWEKSKNTQCLFQMWEETEQTIPRNTIRVVFKVCFLFLKSYVRIKMWCITYLRVSLVLQVEHEKQLTHQALLRADTTEGVTQRQKTHMNIHKCFILKQHFVNYWTIHPVQCTNYVLYHTDTHHRLQSHGCRDSTHHQRAWQQRKKGIKLLSSSSFFFIPLVPLLWLLLCPSKMLLLTWL